MRDEITTQITTLITRFTRESHRGLCEAVATVREGLNEREEALGAFTTQHEVEAERATRTAENLVGILQHKTNEGRQIKEDGLKVGSLHCHIVTATR